MTKKKLKIEGRKLKDGSYRDTFNWLLNSRERYFPLEILEDDKIYNCTIIERCDDYHTYTTCIVNDVDDDCDEFLSNLKDGQLMITDYGTIVRVEKHKIPELTVGKSVNSSNDVKLYNLRYKSKPLTKKILNDYIIDETKKEKQEYKDKLNELNSLRDNLMKELK